MRIYKINDLEMEFSDDWTDSPNLYHSFWSWTAYQQTVQLQSFAYGIQSTFCKLNISFFIDSLMHFDKIKKIDPSKCIVKQFRSPLLLVNST